MGKSRDLFKKIRYTKGTCHAKMGSIKDRNGMDLTEAEDIKKRWQEYTEELYKKDLHYPNNHDGVITHNDHTRIPISPHPGQYLLFSVIFYSIHPNEYGAVFHCSFFWSEFP